MGTDNQVGQPADVLLTKENAVDLQAGAAQAHDLLVWTVTQDASDAAAKFVARPSSSKLGGIALSVRLEADTLQELRDLLPPGLHRANRDEGDDPVIIESWL